MTTILLTCSILVAPFQASQDSKVGWIFVNSSYNNRIIFEYAHAAIPEDMLLPEGAVDCLLSELKGTGLFTDVRAELKLAEDGQKVNITITPTWHPRIERFLIDEIVFAGFEGINEDLLRWNLHQKDLSPGVPLMRHSLKEILRMVKDATREIYKAEPKMEDRIDDMLLNLSFRVKAAAPERVKLTIISGSRSLCK